MRPIKSITAVLFLALNLFTSHAQIADSPEDICPLLIGEIVPESALISGEGVEMNVSELIEGIPTILVFYRGGWCPYCNRQLSAFAVAEEEILDLGYQILAISPDDYMNIVPLTEEEHLCYQVFSDPGSQFIQGVGIAFKATQKTQNYISRKSEGEITEVLPVPTVMVLGRNGEILFEYICPNYKERITPELLLAILKNLE